METAADEPQRGEEPEDAVPARAGQREADESNDDQEPLGDDDSFVPL
jgi:hypothetical protein